MVISGIGLLASVGDHRESVWNAVQRGRSGVRRLGNIGAVPGLDLLGAPVRFRSMGAGELKTIPIARRVAAEALADAAIDWRSIDRHRFGCSISAHIADDPFVAKHDGRSGMLPAGTPWHTQWMPSTTCAQVASDYGLYGPRYAHATACASSSISVIAASRAIQDGECEWMLVGGAEAIHPLMAAGFESMRVLARHDDPVQACRPFDSERNGFVMGEGGAMLVLERLDVALDRGATIYAEVLGGQMLNDARHVTALGGDCTAITHLISSTVKKVGLVPGDIQLINAHGTGTQQNDLMESRGIRAAMGAAAHRINVTANKSMLGHLVNASGAVELALTALAMRDSYCPPTLNLTSPDPECDLDCTPLLGRDRQIEHALKLSIAFGGHLAAVALRRWQGPGEMENHRDQSAEASPQDIIPLASFSSSAGDGSAGRTGATRPARTVAALARSCCG